MLSSAAVAAPVLKSGRLPALRSEYDSIGRKRHGRSPAVVFQAIHLAVADLSSRSPETVAHLRCVGDRAALLAPAFGWRQSSLADFGLAGSLHDIGKVALPDEILLKPGRLTKSEFQRVKDHPRIGAELLQGSHMPVLEMAASIALCHHECWDGSGYPYGLSGEDVPLAARIVAVVDFFTALREDRSYRRAIPFRDVIAIMRARCGTHFDPLVLECFLDVVRARREALEDV